MGRYCAGLCCTREAGIGSAGVAVGHGRGGARGARQGKGETRWTPGALAIVHRLVMVVKLCPSSASGREVPQRALRDGPIAGRRATASFWGRCSPVPVPAQRGGHSSERSASAWGGPIHPRIVRYHSTRPDSASHQLSCPNVIKMASPVTAPATAPVSTTIALPWPRPAADASHTSYLNIPSYLASFHAPALHNTLPRTALLDTTPPPPLLPPAHKHSAVKPRPSNWRPRPYPYTKLEFSCSCRAFLPR